MIDKPFSQACENNKRAILDVLKSAFKQHEQVLEIGSGTGQHAVFFAKHLAHLQWQSADQSQYHDGINAWIDDFPSDNLHRPLLLSLPQTSLPTHHVKTNAPFDAYFSANTAHIMQSEEVEFMMAAISHQLPTGGSFCQYGPFKQNGQFSSQSNADFHQSLIESGRGGYRDIDELERWAPQLVLKDIVNMPANNLLLIWVKK